MSDQPAASHTTIDQSGQTVYGPQTNIVTSIHLTRLDPTDRRNQRNHAVLRQAVHRFWIEGVLHSSLYNAVLIRLGLDARPDAVDNRPWDLILQQAGQPDKQIADDKSLVELFEDMDQQLLILGEPGSGKTTTLLTLADGLLARTAANPTLPTPVVFNLSSWAEKQPKLADWLVEELNIRYQIPRKVAQTWVTNDELLLLLDGLDEVAETKRAACVDAINTFRQEHIVAIAVCSRAAEYTALTNRLKLIGAVVIRPLTPPQIADYIAHSGSHVTALHHAFANSAELRDLARSPLFLSIMTLAYHDQAVPDAIRYVANRTVQQHLFDHYIVRMFQHRALPHLYPSNQTLYWVRWLARKMAAHNQTLFFIERLQPNWLANKGQFNLYRLLVGLTTGILFLLSTWSSTNLAGERLGALVTGIIFGSYSRIEAHEYLSFSWKNSLLGGLLGGLLSISIFGFGGALSGGLIGGWFGGLFNVRSWKELKGAWRESVIYSLIYGLIIGLLFGIKIGLFLCLSIALIFGLSSGWLIDKQLAEDKLKVHPNQGIWQSLKNGLTFGLVVGLSFGLISRMNIGLRNEDSIRPATCLSESLAS